MKTKYENIVRDELVRGYYNFSRTTIGKKLIPMMEMRTPACIKEQDALIKMIKGHKEEALVKRVISVAPDAITVTYHGSPCKISIDGCRVYVGCVDSCLPTPERTWLRNLIKAVYLYRNSEDIEAEEAAVEEECVCECEAAEEVIENA